MQNNDQEAFSGIVMGLKVKGKKGTNYCGK